MTNIEMKNKKSKNRKRYECLSEKKRDEAEEVALAMVFYMSEKERDEVEEVVFAMMFSVSEKEREREMKLKII